MEATLSEYQKIEKYTKQRIKQLKGEARDVDISDPDSERYIRQRLEELRCENKDVDRPIFNRYALATMAVYPGDD